MWIFKERGEKVKRVVISSKTPMVLTEAGCTGYVFCGSCKEGKLTP